MPYYPKTSPRMIEDAANDPVCDNGARARAMQIEYSERFGDLFVIMGEGVDDRECEERK